MNTFAVSSQTVQQEKESLVSVLKTLEKRYNISFSYTDNTVMDKEANLPDENLSLTEVLSFLAEITSLKFEMLSNRFVVIQNPENEIPEDTPEIEHLEDIVISNYLTSGITKTSDGTININPNAFGILPGLIEPDVLQTTQALPGVLSVDETVSNINVRGGTHDENLFLWEGIKMYQSGHFFGLISAFNPYLTEEVNILKNGTNPKYGDGISSVIDMRLSDSIHNKFESGAGINLINADMYVKVPLSKKVELQLSSRRSITDLISTPTYDQYFKRAFQDSDLNVNGSNSSISDDEQFFFHDVSAKLLYDFTPKDKLRFNFLNTYNNLNYLEQSETNNIVNNAFQSHLSQENLALGFNYKRYWTNKLITNAQVSYSNYDIDATNFDVKNDQRLIQENEVKDLSTRLDINYTINDKFKINGGYQFSEVGISNFEDINNPEFSSYIKRVIRSNSLYTENVYTSKNLKTNFKFGGRLNYIEKFKRFLLEPRLNFNHQFSNYFKLEVLGELKSQTTTQIIDLQNDFLGIEKRRWVLSNEKTIPIKKSKQLSLGVHYNHNKLLISAEGYIKQVDGITTRGQGFQNQYQFVNATGNYNIVGIDFLLRSQFNKKLNAWLSYSHNKNSYMFEGLNNGFSFPNNNDIRHSATIASTYTHNNIKLALSYNWHSGKPTTTSNGLNGDNTIIYNSPNSEKLVDYKRADFSTTYSFNIFKKSKAIIGASVWNIFDRKNIINIYCIVDDDNNIKKIENQSLGITPNVSFRVTF